MQRILFAYSSSTGTTAEYHRLLVEEFKAKLAEKSMDNVEVSSCNVAVATEVGKIDNIKEIKNLVLLYPVNMGKIEKNMTNWMKKASFTNVKNAAAFAVCGQAALSENNKLSDEKRKKLTQDYVVKNIEKKLGKEGLKKFKVMEILGGIVTLEKLPLIQRVLFQFLAGMKNKGEFDIHRVKDFAGKLVDTFFGSNAEASPSSINESENAMASDALKEIVRPFYERCLTVNTETDVAEVLGKLLADDFISHKLDEKKTKAALIGQVQYFWKLIPNLRWEIQDMVCDGNRVCVRSIASGNPIGSFMGKIECNGDRQFKIVTTDIHEIVDSQINCVYHVEDWATAFQQLNTPSPKEIVRPFYEQCLTVNNTANPSEVLGKLLADDFISYKIDEQKTKAALIGQVQYFWKLIPNLRWEIQDMIQDGNRVCVRSIASGSPVGNFFGVECNGDRSFKIVTTDIHEIANSQIKHVHHVEDWASALQQLKTPQPKEIVRPFYEKCLTVNDNTNIAEVLGALLADDFISYKIDEKKDKAALMGQIQYFWKLIPNLKWEIQDMITDGNKITVRSIASGTPVGNFMGVDCTSGEKSFKIVTIDIHEIVNNQIKCVNHAEDWATAIQQLKA